MKTTVAIDPVTKRPILDPRTGKPVMVATGPRTPAIPEIAKAYSDDPRTKVAVQAMANGASSAPVAAGKYAIADGAARVLQAGLGGFINRQQQAKYGSDQDQLIAQRAARGQDGMSGQNINPAIASAAAATLNGNTQGPPQPPGPAEGGVPSIPMAPIPPAAQTAPQMPPGPPGATPPSGVTPIMPQRGGAQGMPPFGGGFSSTKAPAFLAAPTQEVVPDAPAPVAKPTRPEAVGAGRSKLLDAAYRVMADANPYESASGQDMYTQGLADQDKLNESAAERKQRLIEGEYATDRSIYADATGQDRGAQIKGREDVIARNAKALDDYKNHIFDYGVHKEDQSFTAGENAKARSSAYSIAKLKEDGDDRRANMKMAGGISGLTAEEQDAVNKASVEGRVDLMRLASRPKAAKIIAQVFIANPTFDAMTNHGIATLAANAGAQQKAIMANMLPQVLENVRDAGKKLNFSNFEPLGKVQLKVRGLENDPDVTAYMTQRNDAMQTLAQVMSGVGATDMRTKMETDAAPKAMSPRAWDAWYEGQLHALQPRIDAYRGHKLLPTVPGATTAKPTVSNW